MLPDQVSNPGPLTYESDALPIALRAPAKYGLLILKSELHMPRSDCTLAHTQAGLSLLSSQVAKTDFAMTTL